MLAVLRKSIGIAGAGLLLVGGVFPSPARAASGWRWPVRGAVITAYRNATDPYAAGQHRGIDIAAPTGTPVVAATGGTVRFAGRVGFSGLVVAVRTGDGRFDTSYLHLSAIAVRRGQRVQPGQRLGAIGTTGRRSAAQPHLHFGVRDAGSRHGYHDPLDFLPPAGPPASRAPHGAPAPVAAPSPVRAAPRGEPWSMPAGRRLWLPAPHSVPNLLPSPRLAPAAQPEPAPRPWPTSARVPLPSQVAGVHQRGQAGVDPGWLLLCVGLLLAGAVMAATPDARRRGARGGARLRAALRPLLGLER